MLKLTARQEQILDLIRAPSSAPASRRPAPKSPHELGFRSANAAEEHLQALARKGVIEISPGTSRGIRLRRRRGAARAARGQLALPHPA